MRIEPDGFTEVNALPPDLPPRFLSRVQSAAYLGVCPGTFSDEVAKGMWPQGRSRGAKGGKLTWDRVLLDRAADALSGLLTNATLALVAEDARNVSELDRRIAAQAAQRALRRKFAGE